MRRFLVGLAVASQAFAAPPPAPAKPAFNRLSRPDFNQKAQEHFVPLFWRDDADKNGSLEPAELAVLWGPQGASRATYVDEKGAFTKAFLDAYEAMVKGWDDKALPADEQKRRAAIRLELSQGRPTLIETDLSKGSEEDRAIVKHVFAAAVVLEKIHARQLGAFGLEAKDPSSQSVLHRNQSPFCTAPKTEKDEACTAIAPKPARLSGLYPAEVQADPKFCDALAKAKNAKDLTGHFSVVVADGKGFKAVPYSEAYKAEMEQVATSLEAAADASRARAKRPSRSTCARRRRRSAPTTGNQRTRRGSRWGRRTRSGTSASRPTRSTTSPVRGRPASRSASPASTSTRWPGSRSSSR